MSRLGVDLGTSNTAAVLARDDGRVTPLLFDGVPVLASGVCLLDGGELVVGPDAVHAAAGRPECYEPYPKQRVDDGTVLLGTVEVPVVDLLAAVLRRVAAEATRAGDGVPPSAVTVTHPASWGAVRRDVLLRSVVAAGLPEPTFVTEPVAAAAYHVAVHDAADGPRQAAPPGPRARTGPGFPAGSALVVYDCGAGTFDVSVVRRDSAGFTTLAVDGRDGLGGLDVDAALLARVVEASADLAPDGWSARPTLYRALWNDVRAAKEMLSRASSSVVHNPFGGPDLPVGREEFDRLVEPVLAQTVQATVDVIRAAGLTPDSVAGVLLVGGSSRIPLVATLLHRALGVAPTVLDQPELAVATGAVHVATTQTVEVTWVSGTGASWPAPAPVPARPEPAPARHGSPRQPVPVQRSWKRPAVVVFGLLVVVLLVPAAVTPDGRAALALGVRAPLGPTGWLVLVVAVGLAALAAPATAPRALLGGAAAIGASYVAVLIGLSEVDLRVGVVVAGVLAIVLGGFLLAGGRLRPRRPLAAGVAVAVAGQTRAYPHADALAAVHDTVLSAAWPAAVTRGVLVAVGAAVVALAAGSAAELGRRGLAGRSRAVRGYLAGLGYGLCVAVGLLLAYHGWTELRGGGAAGQAVLARVWPVGLVVATALLLAGLAGLPAAIRARPGGRRSRARPVRPPAGRA